MKRVFVGITVAICTAAILIYSIETDRSFYQIAAGFAIYFLPFVFLLLLRSALGAFAFTFSTLIVGYLIWSNGWYDILLGSLTAAIVGGALFAMRVKPYETFDVIGYKNSMSINESKGPNNDA